MKIGGIDHPKTHNLAAALGVHLLHAAGLLEALFHFTAEYAPRGDIGRYTDEHIARGVHHGEAPGKLIKALVKTGWLDEDRQHRLVVHDWHDHAAAFVRRKLQRHGQQFVASNGRPTTVTSQGDRSDRSVESTRPTTPRHATPRPSSKTPSADAGASPYTKAFEAFWSVVWRKVGKRAAFEAWKRAVRRASAATITEAAAAFAQSPAGKAGPYSPHPATWLRQGRWEDDQADWQLAASADGSGPKGGGAVQSAHDRIDATAKGQPR